jgi:hypothetical protein
MLRNSFAIQAAVSASCSDNSGAWCNCRYNSTSGAEFSANQARGSAGASARQLTLWPEKLQIANCKMQIPN